MNDKPEPLLVATTAGALLAEYGAQTGHVANWSEVIETAIDAYTQAALDASDLAKLVGQLYDDADIAPLNTRHEAAEAIRNLTAALEIQKRENAAD